MIVVTGAFAAFALLVALAGAFKIALPLPTVIALRPFVRSARPTHVRLLGALEVALGASAAILAGLPLELAVAALYATFAGFVARARRHGATSSCGCFGAAARVTVAHVAINAGAAAVAATAAVARAPGLARAVPDQALGGVPLLVATATAVYALYRVLVASPRREPLTAISGFTPSGEATTVALDGAGGSTVLVFLSSTCVTCRTFWASVARRGAGRSGVDRVVVVTKGPEVEDAGALRALAPSKVATVMASEAWQAYGVPGAPYGVLVDGTSGAVVSEATASTWPELRQRLEPAPAKVET